MWVSGMMTVGMDPMRRGLSRLEGTFAVEIPGVESGELASGFLDEEDESEE